MKKAIAFFIILLFLTSAITMTTLSAKADTNIDSVSAQTIGSSSLTSGSVTTLNDSTTLPQHYVIDQDSSLSGNLSGQNTDSLFSSESLQVQNASLHPAYTPQAESSSIFSPLDTPPQAVYDLQLGLTFSQNYSALSYNVTAVQQVDENGYGPGYLLNGLTDKGFWYQVGVAFDWPYSIGGYVPGWHFVYWIFSNNGSLIYGNAIDFSGPVNDGDVILLSLEFSNGNVVMFGKDWNTSSIAQLTYSSIGGSYFKGLVRATNDAHGFFTGLMTEWWHVNPFYGNEAQSSLQRFSFRPVRR